MPHPPHDPSNPRRPHSAPLDRRYLELDLDREIGELEREPEWPQRHNARTLAKYGDLRLVLVGLKAQAQVAPHRTAGSLSIHALRGHVRIHADGRTFDLRGGSLLALEPDLEHSVEAIEDSTLLLTIGRV